MRIYIIRHGETDANARGVLSGWTDTPLNENGRRLAVLTGRGMGPLRFDACISSPLSRAWETAELVLRETGNGNLPIASEPRIKEINFGTLEGMKITDAAAQLHFTDPFKMPRCPGGEDIAMVCRRTQEFLWELSAREDIGTCLVATHGCALRGMLNFLYATPTDYWHGHVPYNCAVNILEAEGGRIRLVEEDRIYYDPSLIVDRYAAGWAAETK